MTTVLHVVTVTEPSHSSDIDVGETRVILATRHAKKCGLTYSRQQINEPHCELMNTQLPLSQSSFRIVSVVSHSPSVLSCGSSPHSLIFR